MTFAFAPAVHEYLLRPSVSFKTYAAARVNVLPLTSKLLVPLFLVIVKSDGAAVVVVVVVVGGGVVVVVVVVVVGGGVVVVVVVVAIETAETLTLE